MNTPKKHHLVAQMVLRRFCDPTGRLYVYNKRAPGLGFAHKETDATFFERHLDLTGILDRANWKATAWWRPWVAGRPDPGG